VVNSLTQAQGPELILQNSEKKKERNRETETERERKRGRERDFEIFQKEQANLKVSRDLKNDESSQIETRGKRIKQRVVSLRK
jgi:hypothetical protein